MYLISQEFNKVITFAQQNFKNIRDGAGGLIFEHNLRVAFWLEQYLIELKIKITKKEKELITAAALHDIVEDTQVSVGQIKKLFGKNIAKWVKELTISFENVSIKEAVKPLYNYSDEAIIIKMFDVYDNVKKSPYFIEKNDKDWIVNFWIPLLKEYKKIFTKKINSIKIYKNLAKKIYTDVIKEIDNFLTFFKIYNI